MRNSDLEYLLYLVKGRYSDILVEMEWIESFHREVCEKERYDRLAEELEYLDKLLLTLTKEVESATL